MIGVFVRAETPGRERSGFVVADQHPTEVRLRVIDPALHIAHQLRPGGERIRRATDIINVLRRAGVRGEIDAGQSAWSGPWVAPEEAVIPGSIARGRWSTAATAI